MKFQVGDVVKPMGVSHWCLILEMVGPIHALCRHMDDESNFTATYWIKGAKTQCPLVLAIMQERKETHAKV